MALWQQRQGAPDKPRLVLLHGWGLNSAIWSGLIDLLTEDFSVQCIDLPGFGQSDAATDWSQAVQQVAQAIEPGSLLLGWSLGGLFAQAIALRWPDKLRGLVLVASSPCFAQRADWQPAMKPEVLADFQQKLSQDFAKTLEQFLALQALGSPNFKHEVRFLKSVVMNQGQASSQTLSLGLDWLAQIDLRAELAALSVPSLWWFGRLDALVPLACSDWIAGLPQAQIQIEPKASHAPFLSDPQSFCQRLRQFDAELS